MSVLCNLPYHIQCDIEDMEYAWEMLQNGIFYRPYFGIYNGLKADLYDCEESGEITKTQADVIRRIYLNL